MKLLKNAGAARWMVADGLVAHAAAGSLRAAAGVDLSEILT